MSSFCRFSADQRGEGTSVPSTSLRKSGSAPSAGLSVQAELCLLFFYIPDSKYNSPLRPEFLCSLCEEYQLLQLPQF